MPNQPADAPVIRAYADLGVELRGLSDSRPPLVLLHQLGGDHSDWSPCLDALALLDPGRLSLAIDLPGHGSSLPKLPHSTGHLVQAVHQAVSQAEIEAPVMVGHWTSAYLAHAYAADFPVEGVIAVEPFPSLLEIAAALQAQMHAEKAADFMAVWASITAGDLPVDAISPLGHKAAGKWPAPKADTIRSYWQELLDLHPRELGRLMASDSHALEAANIPFRIITGHITVPQRARIDEMIPSASVEVWHGGGHFPHLAFPERFAQRLAEASGWEEQ